MVSFLDSQSPAHVGTIGRRPDKRSGAGIRAWSFSGPVDDASGINLSSWELRNLGNPKASQEGVVAEDWTITSVMAFDGLECGSVIGTLGERHGLAICGQRASLSK